MILNTEKGSRREVTFDSQNGKYASQLSCGASSEAYLYLRVVKPLPNVVFSYNVTNTPQVKHHRIIAKRICHFVSQMILHAGTLLQ
jgi:hypothetical protein